MRTDRISPLSSPASSIEPSRAWILGVVIESDGTLTVPQPADAGWPVAGDDRPARDSTHHTPDGPSVRP